MDTGTYGLSPSEGAGFIFHLTLGVCDQGLFLHLGVEGSVLLMSLQFVHSCVGGAE